MRTILFSCLLLCCFNVFAYHDPNTGRFLSRDPIGEDGGNNLYAIVNNDTINKWDFLGLRIPVEVKSTITEFLPNSSRNQGQAELDWAEWAEPYLKNAPNKNPHAYKGLNTNLPEFDVEARFKPKYKCECEFRIKKITLTSNIGIAPADREGSEALNATRMHEKGHRTAAELLTHLYSIILSKRKHCKYDEVQSLEKCQEKAGTIATSLYSQWRKDYQPSKPGIDKSYNKGLVDTADIIFKALVEVNRIIPDDWECP
jgi:hypothetical protein